MKKLIILLYTTISITTLSNTTPQQDCSELNGQFHVFYHDHPDAFVDCVTDIAYYFIKPAKQWRDTIVRALYISAKIKGGNTRINPKFYNRIIFKIDSQEQLDAYL